MALYEYATITTYDQRGMGEQYDRETEQTVSGFLDAGDDTFTVGVDVDGMGGTYIGYLAEGGFNYPVFQFTGGLRIYGPPSAPAAQEDPFGINQDLTDENLTVCFAAGTLVATSTGEIPVEELRIGELIHTACGRLVPVKWIGRQTVHKLFSMRERFVPVRVSVGALGSNLPHTDLELTADHALVVDGLAINAGALVNGTSISYVPYDTLPERMTYYHIETEGHEVIFANGTPAETYVDYVGRRAFDNYREYVDLYGDDRTIQEMPLPRVSSARLLPPEVRAQLKINDAA